MEIFTKFAIGDKAWKISESKAACFEVRYILYDGQVYFGETRFDMTVSEQCFASKEELLKYVANDGN